MSAQASHAIIHSRQCELFKWARINSKMLILNPLGQSLVDKRECKMERYALINNKTRNW